MSYKKDSAGSLHEKKRRLEYVGLKKVHELTVLKDRAKTAESESKTFSYNSAAEIIQREVEEIQSKIHNINEEITHESKNNNFPLQKEKKQHFPPLSFLDLIQLPPKQWLLNQVFGVGDIGAIYGPPGCGKTFVVIDMIMSICTGKSWANRFSVSRPLNVAYCAGEGFGGLPSRFQTAADYYNVQNLPNFTFFKSTPQLYKDPKNEEPAESIYHFIHEWSERQQKKETEALDVLIIDTLHTASVGSDENSSMDMGIILKACKYAVELLGCTIILIHHTTKNGATERGSSALRGAMDFMLFIEKSDKEGESKATMTCSKLKDGEQWVSQSFHLNKPDEAENVHVLWNDPNEVNMHEKTSKNMDKSKIMHELEKNPNVGFESGAISEILGQAKNYTIKILNELLDTNFIYRKLAHPEKAQSSRNPWLYYYQE